MLLDKYQFIVKRTLCKFKQKLIPYALYWKVLFPGIISDVGSTRHSDVWLLLVHG